MRAGTSGFGMWTLHDTAAARRFNMDLGGEGDAAAQVEAAFRDPDHIIHPSPGATLKT